MRRGTWILIALGCVVLLCTCIVGMLGYNAKNTAALGASSGSVSETEVTLALSFGERTGTYSGEVAGGLPHGQGTFESRNSDGEIWVYEGAWEQGHMCGEGETAFELGYAEAGWYDNDCLNGWGTIRQDGRIVYEGVFKDNTPDGEGTLYSYSGEAIYSGSFAEGYINETKEAREVRIGQVKRQCVPTDYETLYQSAQSEDGAFVEVTGEVTYVIEDDGSDYDYSFVVCSPDAVSTGYSDQVCVCYRLSAGEAPVAAGLTVTVWAQAGYLYTAEFEDGTSASLPLIEAWDVRDVSGIKL